MEEPGGLQSLGSWRVGHDWVTSLSLFTFMHWRRKWQPTPVFLPGESQGQGSLVGCRLWGHRVRHDWSNLAAAAESQITPDKEETAVSHHPGDDTVLHLCEWWIMQFIYTACVLATFFLKAIEKKKKAKITLCLESLQQCQLSFWKSRNYLIKCHCFPVPKLVLQVQNVHNAKLSCKKKKILHDSDEEEKWNYRNSEAP